MNGSRGYASWLLARLRTRGIKSTASSFGSAIASRLGQLVLGILLARQFGTSAYGVFTFALGLATLGASFSILGWGMVMTRFIPVFIRDRDWPRLRGLRFAGDVSIMAGSLAAAAVCLLIALFVERLAYGLMLGALLIVPFTFASLRRVQLAAIRRPGTGLMLDQGFGALLVLGALLLWGISGPGNAVIHYAGATAFGVLIATAMFRRGLPVEVRGASRQVEYRNWLAVALPSVIGHSAKQLMNRMDVLLLAPLATMEQVGLFGAAFRLTYLLTFPQLVLMTAMWPLFGEALSAGDTRRLRMLHRNALIFAALTSLPFTAAALLFPTQILTIVFGPDYAVAGSTLVALTVAQQASSFAISYTAVVALGGREKAFSVVNVGALLLNVLLNLALIPSYGALGSAIGTAISSILVLLGQMYLSRPVLAHGP